jgi:hypothetical protein
MRGTRRSLIIQPSYQPASLLMTNRPEKSMKTSMKACGSSGLVGSPGLGSNTTRTEPMVFRPPLAAFAAVRMTPSLMPGITAVNTLGWKFSVSSR